MPARTPARHRLIAGLTMSLALVGVSVLPATGRAADSAPPDRAPMTARCTTEPYPPYLGPSLPGQGWLWALTEAAFAAKGVKATLEFLPWARALEDTRNGARDCLLAAFYSRERAQWFVYSAPLGEVRTGFFRRRDRNDIVFTGNVAALQPWSIGVGRGYANSEAFDRAQDLQKIQLNSSEQGLRMLYLGRLDLMAGAESVDRYNIRHLLEPQHPGIGSALIFMEPPLQVQPLYVAISRQHKRHGELLERLNAGLAQLKADGSWRRILERHAND